MGVAQLDPRPPLDRRRCTGRAVACACGQSNEPAESETARWLRAAAGFNETPELIDCMETAMDEELSREELREWLSHKPETITVEQIQVLPRAIDVADRCRHLLPSAP